MLEREREGLGVLFKGDGTQAPCGNVTRRCSSGHGNTLISLDTVRMEMLRPQVSDFDIRPESFRAAGNNLRAEEQEAKLPGTDPWPLVSGCR